MFCEKVLCDRAVMHQLDTHCVLWPWDVTDEANRNILLAFVSSARPLEYLSDNTTSFAMPRSLARSSSVAARIQELLRRNSSPDELPALYIVFRREPADLHSVTAATFHLTQLSRIAVYETSGNRLTADELASILEEAYNSCTNSTRTLGLKLSLLLFCSLVLHTLSTGHIKNTFHRIKYFPLQR